MESEINSNTGKWFWIRYKRWKGKITRVGALFLLVAGERKRILLSLPSKNKVLTSVDIKREPNNHSFRNIICHRMYSDLYKTVQLTNQILFKLVISLKR